ncbi:hypothetical protein DFQ28_005030 [Apophysomyces sp. BC1034]|nr:hypothetical protein DFQ28_005030 [Apophysomyces sp. BC1034]
MSYTFAMDTTIKLFCLIGNETSLRAFEIEIDSTATVSKLKDIDAYKLTLWLVEIPEDKEGFAITLGELVVKEELTRPRKTMTALFPTPPNELAYIFM